MSQDTGSGFLPPLMMFRSFLTLASSIVLHAISAVAITYIIGILFFPEFQAFQKLPLEEQAEMFAKSPDEAISTTMFWTVVTATSAVNFFIGAYASRTAPFSNLAHSIFLAVMLFVHYLQQTSGQVPEKKTMTIVFMVAYPIAIMLGGRWMSNRMLRPLPASSDDEMPNEPDDELIRNDNDDAGC